MAESPDERKRRKEAELAAQAAQRATQEAAKAANKTKPGAPTATTTDWANKSAREAAAPGDQPAVQPTEPQPEQAGGPPGAAVDATYNLFTKPGDVGLGSFGPQSVEKMAQGGTDYPVHFGPQSVEQMAQAGTRYPVPLGPKPVEQMAQAGTDYAVNFAPAARGELRPSAPNPLGRPEGIFERAINKKREGKSQTLDALSQRVEEVAENYRRTSPEEQVRRRQSEREASPDEKRWLQERHPTATPEERERMRVEYRDLLKAKTAAGRDVATGEAGPRVKSDEEKRADYRRSLVRQGQDPDLIGNSGVMVNLPDGRRTMEVLSPRQEIAIRNGVNRNAREMQILENNERVLRRKKDPASIQAAMEYHKQRMAKGVAEGFVDPVDPQAGMNTSNAFRVRASQVLAEEASKRMARETSTLPAVAMQQPESPARAIQNAVQPLPAPTAADQTVYQTPAQVAAQSSQQDLQDLAYTRFLREQQAWAEEMRRRQAAVMGQYARLS